MYVRVYILYQTPTLTRWGGLWKALGLRQLNCSSLSSSCRADILVESGRLPEQNIHPIDRKKGTHAYIYVYVCVPIGSQRPQKQKYILIVSLHMRVFCCYCPLRASAEAYTRGIPKSKRIKTTKPSHSAAKLAIRKAMGERSGEKMNLAIQTRAG